MDVNEIRMMENLKLFFRHYKLETLLSLIFVLGYLYYVNLTGCSYTLTKDIMVYGNCKQLSNYSNYLKYGSMPDFSSDAIPAVVAVPFMVDSTSTSSTSSSTLLVVESTTTTTETITTTTVKQCPKIDLQAIKNARPDLENSPYQAGYMRMKRTCLVAVGEKAPKFNEGPAVTGYGDYYNLLKGENTSQTQYCFLKTDGYPYGFRDDGFILNASAWNWTNLNMTWTVWNITENASDYHTEWNTSGNLWVKRV